MTRLLESHVKTPVPAIHPAGGVCYRRREKTDNIPPLSPAPSSSLPWQLMGASPPPHTVAPTHLSLAWSPACGQGATHYLNKHVFSWQGDTCAGTATPLSWFPRKWFQIPVFLITSPSSHLTCEDLGQVELGVSNKQVWGLMKVNPKWHSHQTRLCPSLLDMRSSSLYLSVSILPNYVCLILRINSKVNSKKHLFPHPDTQ
jgi:hypothetical protein